MREDIESLKKRMIEYHRQVTDNPDLTQLQRRAHDEVVRQTIEAKGVRYSLLVITHIFFGLA